MTLAEQINDGIKEAMKSKNLVRLNTLRMLKSKILAVDARGNLADGEVVKLFKNYLGNLQEAYDQALAINRQESADNLKLEMDVVKEFLPKGLSPEETKKLVAQAIAESGAKTKRDLGLVMKAVAKLNSSIDGKTAKEFADQLLE